MSTPTTASLLDAALEHARAGRAVIALHCVVNGQECSCHKGPKCGNIGKHPQFHKDDLPNGCLSATTDEEVIRRWWKRWPYANIGIATGAKSGFFVLDVDPQHGGDETLAELEAMYGRLPNTAEAITGGGGRHVLFGYVEGIPNEVGQKDSARLGVGLDTRSDGGLIVAPGSVHKSGRTYEWEGMSHPDDVPIAAAPEWLIGLLRKPREGTVDKGTAEPVPQIIPEGSRDRALFKAACSMRAKGFGQGAIEAALLVTNRECCRPPMDEEEVRKKAAQACRYPAGESFSVMWRGGEAPPEKIAAQNGKHHAPAEDLSIPPDPDIDTEHPPFPIEDYSGLASSDEAAALVEALITSVSASKSAPEVFTAVNSLALLPKSAYASAKARLRDILGKGINLNDLDGAVREARKANSGRRRRDVASTHPGLPQIVTNNRQLRDVVDDTLEALHEANTPPELFVRSGAMVQIQHDEHGATRIRATREPEIRVVMSRSADFLNETMTDDGPSRSAVSPPREVAQSVLAEVNAWRFPALVGVTEVPFLRPDGSVLNTPGYDPHTRLIYAPAQGLDIPPVPEVPTDEEVRRAAALIQEPFCDFPFEDKASRANALGLLLTFIARPAIAGCTMMALIDAPQAGTGKGLLAQVASLIGTGRIAATMTAPKDEEEWRKQITATLRDGVTAIIIDNIELPLYSAVLASALTTTLWRDRIMGLSENATLPQRAVWMATGNNIKLGGDMPRRCFPIRIDAKMVRPFNRDGFKYPDLLGWVAEHRGELLAALLTLARHWFVKGKPRPKVKPVGSFEEWTVMVGGILESAGIEGFLSNLPEMHDRADEDTPQWEAFFLTWHSIFGETEQMGTDIVKEVKKGELLRDAMPDQLVAAMADNEATFTKKLGKALSRRADVRFTNGIHVTRGKTETRTGRAYWKVKVAEGEPESAGLHISPISTAPTDSGDHHPLNGSIKGVGGADTQRGLANLPNMQTCTDPEPPSLAHLAGGAAIYGAVDLEDDDERGTRPWEMGA